MKKTTIFILFIFMAYVVYCQTYHKRNDNKYMLKYSTVIFTDEDKSLPFFIFPKGVSIYYDGDSKYFDGFSRYIIYVNISDADTGDNGILEKSPKDGMISPVYLYKIDDGIIEYMEHNASISKKELMQLIQQSGIAKKDLEDILRAMPNDK